MRLTIESGPITELAGVPVRAWRVVDGPEGAIAYVHRIAVPLVADQAELEQHLQAQAEPPLDPSAGINALHQVEQLARFIMARIPGEPSRSEGAVETAMRLLEVLVPESGRVAVPLTRAECGLLAALLTADATAGEGGTVYEIIPTGEKSHTLELLGRFAQLVIETPAARK